MAGFFRALFGKKTETTAGVEPAEEGHSLDVKPIHVTDETFQQAVLEAQVPVLVDFWAPWCGPCRMIAPIVEQLAQEYGDRAVVAKVNTDENTRFAGELGIMGIPTIVFFRNGQEADRITGFAPRRAIEDRLKALLG